MNKIKKLVWYEKVFVWATIALLAFGIMGHFLGKLCGSYLDEWQTPPIDSIVSSLFFDKYLLWLALSIAVGVLLYKGMNYLCKANTKLKRVRVILAVILAAWNAFMTIACIMISIDTDDLHPIYEGSDIAWYASRSEEIQRMRSKSILLGHGDHYYTYPDHESLKSENYIEENEEIHDVVEKEHTRAYCAFVRWQSETLLPVLSYCFGKWIAIAYAAIALLWLTGVTACLAAIKGIGRKLLYSSCASLVGVQVILTLLDYYGITCWEMPVVFSTADWTAMIPVATIPLTTMLFLVLDRNNTSKSDKARWH